MSAGRANVCMSQQINVQDGFIKIQWQIQHDLYKDSFHINLLPEALDMPMAHPIF